jgi:hypothetical protein
MKYFKILVCFFSLISLIYAYQPTDKGDYIFEVAKSNESRLNGSNGARITLEAFDGFCLKNSGDYRLIDNMMELLKAEKLDRKLSKVILNNQPGSAYKFKLNNIEFFGGYIKNGGCSIVSMPLNAFEVSQYIQKEFKAKFSYKEDVGMQISEFYTIHDSKTYEGDIITITYSKSDLSMGTISYLPNKVITPSFNTAKSCSVDKVTKDKLVIILCGQDEPENKHRFYGSGCVHKSMKMRAENTIAQVYMYNKCGDPDFSKN